MAVVGCFQLRKTIWIKIFFKKSNLSKIEKHIYAKSQAFDEPLIAPKASFLIIEKRENCLNPKNYSDKDSWLANP